MSILEVDEIKAKSASAAVRMPNQPVFNVTKSADQTIPDATLTLVTFDTHVDGGNSGRDINTHGLWANNKLTVTASTAGYYWVYTNIYWESTQDPSGENWGYWRKNGSIIQTRIYTSSLNPPAGRNGCLQVNQVVDLTTAGDYLELLVYFDNGSSGTTNFNQNTVSLPRTTAGGWLVG